MQPINFSKPRWAGYVRYFDDTLHTYLIPWNSIQSERTITLSHLIFIYYPLLISVFALFFEHCVKIVMKLLVGSR